MKRSVVVTGATSFLGSYIVKELCNRGHLVYAIVRPESKAKEKLNLLNNVIVLSANMGDIERWVEKAGRADWFIHFGWDGPGSFGRSSYKIQKKNVEDTIKCLEAAKCLKCTSFLFAGSQAEYGPKEEIITETTTCEPITEYGKAKLEVLQRCLPIADSAGIRWYQARIFSVYGIGDHPYALIPSCIDSFLRETNIKLSQCTQFWNYLHVSDAASMLVDMLERDLSGGVFNIASKDTRILREFVDDIYCACGKRGSYTLGSYISSEPISNLNPDISKIESLIGPFHFISFSNGLHELVDAFNKRNMHFPAQPDGFEKRE